MGGTVKVYGLGTRGVNLVKSPIHMDDNELVRAQNVEPTRQRGIEALATRPGLTPFSQSSLGGFRINGGVGLLLPPPGDNGLAPVFAATRPSLSWTEPDTPATAQDIRDFCWNGSIFVGVGGSGLVYTSTDGITWVARTAAASNNWRGVAWNGTVFAAVSNNGANQVMTSPDGITWTSRSAAASKAWQSVCWAPDLALFIAVASDNASAVNSVMTSSDGITWTGRNASHARAWEGVSWAAEINTAVAIASNAASTDLAMTSTDGITWTAQTTPADSTPTTPFCGSSKIAWSPPLRLFAVSSRNNAGTNSKILTSPDGVTWTSRSIPDPTRHTGGIVWAGATGTFLVSRASDKDWLYSLDGITWTEFDTLLVHNNQATTWAESLGVLVAWNVGSGGTDGIQRGIISSQGWLATVDSGATWSASTTLSRPLSGTRHLALRSLGGITVYQGITVGQILAFDGTREYILCTLPSPSALPLADARLLVANGETVYAVADDGTTQRAYAVNTTTGVVTMIGAELTLTTADIVAGCWYLGRLWVCATNRTLGEVDVTKDAHIYSVRPLAETSWTTERTSAVSSGSNKYQYTDLGSYNGRLYVSASATASASKIEERTATGTWSFVFTGPDNTANDVSQFMYFRLIPIANVFVVGYYCARSGADQTGLFYSTGDAITWTSEFDYKGAGGVGPLLSVWQQGYSIYASARKRLFRRDSAGSWTTPVSNNDITNGTIVSGISAEVYHNVCVTNGGLYFVRSDGFVAGPIPTALVPEVAFFSNVPGRFAVLKRQVVLVNAVSQPIWLDTTGLARYVSLKPPSSPVTVAAGAGTGLTGGYLVRVSFVMKDEVGNTVGESPLGPVSSSLTLANQDISITKLPVSAQLGINCRRVYRTLSDGAVYYHAFDVDDNLITAITNGTPDAAISLVAAPDDLGACPSRLTNIVEWKGRLWAVSANQPDVLAGTAQGKIAQWPISIPVLPLGRDWQGITGFLPRRDDLGVCKRNIIWRLVGDAPTNFAVRKVKEGVGSIAPDSCLVVNDIGYFLGGPDGTVDGIYEWGGEGVNSITDEQTRPWFDSDTYFNRAMFKNAVAAYNPLNHSYILFLAAVGSSVLDRWISYDISGKRFYGPHKTDAFALGCCFVGFDANNNGVLMFGSTTGTVYKMTPGTLHDDTATAIAIDLLGKFHSGSPSEPDMTHAWLQPTILNRAESGGTLTVTPRVGSLEATAGTAQSHSLTLEREVLNRLGVGRLCQLQFTMSTADRGVVLYGYEIPYTDLGRR